MKMKHVANRRRSVSSRAFIALLALVLVIGCVAGGTVAWLVAKTDTVTNTFTYGDINIELWEETGNNYKIVPGVNIKKDPKVTIKGGSEPCYVFVKVDENGTFVKDKVTYRMSVLWTKLEGVEGVDNVWYIEQGGVVNPQTVPILANDQIIVSKDLTKDEIKSITANPTLTFTAYAVQKEGSNNAAEAWAKVNP